MGGLPGLGDAPRCDGVWRRGLGGQIRRENRPDQSRDLADILLVDGNPLNDLSVLQDSNSLLAIMKDGQFHKSFQGRVQSDIAIAAE